MSHHHETSKRIAPATASRTYKEQCISDYMDELDHREWGTSHEGKSIRSEYKDENAMHVDTSSSRGILPGDVHAEFTDLVIPESSLSIGKRLLRTMGYYSSKTNKEDEVTIPESKTNVYGIGYNPFHNAPEFAREKEERERRARNRVERVVGRRHRGEYRTSDVADDPEEEGGEGEERKRLVAYEEQDFIGSKTTGGFALHDDDDDVYEDAAMMSRGNLDEEYNREVYEHHDDVSEDGHDAAHRSMPPSAPDAAPLNDFEGALRSWANHKSTPTASKSSTLPGFVFGKETAQQHTTRFPGPTVPSNFQAGHVFPPHELTNTISYPAPPPPPSNDVSSSVKKTMTPNPVFANIASIMKSRFTSSSSSKITTSKEKQKDSFPVGLSTKTTTSTSSKPSPPSSQPTTNQQQQQKKPLTHITRKESIFIPSSLLCKRFYITPPAYLSNTSQQQQQQSMMNPSLELQHFQQQILPQILASKKDTGATDNETKNPPSSHESNDTPNPPPPHPLPSMDLFQSIFQDDSSTSSSSHSSIHDSEKPPTSLNTQTTPHEPITMTATAQPPTIHDTSTTNVAIVPKQKETSPPDKKRHKSSRHHRRSRSRSRHRRHHYDSSNSSADSSYSRKRKKRARRKERRSKKRKRRE